MIIDVAAWFAVLVWCVWFAVLVRIPARCVWFAAKTADQFDLIGGR
jgi:hypothetical protein